MPLTMPDNRIVALQFGPAIEDVKVETASYMYPGRLVKKGTTDGQGVVVAAATDNPIGVLGFEDAHADSRPSTIDTLYTVNKLVPIHARPGEVYVLTATGANIAKGDPLVPASQGRVTKGATITVTVPSGSTTVTSDAAQPDLVEAGSVPPGGRVVAEARMSVDASGSDKKILAMWK